MNWKILYYRVTYPLWWTLNKIPVKRFRTSGYYLGELIGSQLAWGIVDNPNQMFERFGVPLKEMPKRVILGGIAHKVQVSEGMVVFSQEAGVYGTHQRICFERDSDGSLWYLKFTETWDKVSVSQVIKAYRYVESVYGGNFCHKQPVEANLKVK